MKYREKLIELYKNPPHSGEVEDGEKGEGFNPSCGDEAEIHLKIEGSEIVEARHQSNSCVLATAVIDKLCEHLEGKTVEEALEMDPSDIEDELEVSPSPGREKCVQLPFDTVEDALREQKDET